MISILSILVVFYLVFSKEDYPIRTTDAPAPKKKYGDQTT